MNKAFSIILYAIGAVFVVTFVGQILTFISAIAGVSKLFLENTDAYAAGGIVGSLLYWTMHIAVIYLCFKFGKKLHKKSKLRGRIDHNK